MNVRSPALASGALIVGSVAALDPAGLAPFGPAKWLIVSTLGFAAAMLSLRHSARCHRRSWWAWTALLVLLTLSALVNGDVRVALLGHPDRHFGLLTWTLLLTMFCVGQQLADDVRTLCRAAVVAAGIMGFYSLWELLFGPPIDVATTTRRLLGPFGSAAFLGAACCLLGPISIAVALSEGVDDAYERAHRRDTVLPDRAHYRHRRDRLRCQSAVLVPARRAVVLVGTPKS